MIALHLQASHGYTWHNDVSEQLFVKGYCFDEMGYFYEGPELLEYFSGMNSERGFVNRITTANGCFAVVWKNRNELFAAVDRLRTLPLLWTKTGNQWHLSDEIRQLPGERMLDSDQADLFPHTCHSLGRATLYKGIFQLQAGEYLHFSAENVEIHRYFTYQHIQKEATEVELRATFRTKAKAVCQRLIDSARGRTLLVPLSGGYDSRFLLAMLSYLGYEQVIAFTYGRSSSYEVAISKQVAESLDVPWYMVEYTEDLLKIYLEEDGFAYQAFASNGISVAHEQDYFAIHALLRDKLIPEDCLVVPGFGGDVLAGSWFPNNLPKKLSRKRLIRYLIANRKFFSGTRKLRLDRQAISKMIDKDLLEGEVSDLDSAYAHLQDWGLRNRMSKFLVNAVRVYDFHGLGWRMPFWDHAWMEYWLQVDASYKLGKQLYLSEASRWLFQPMGIDLHPPVSPPSQIRNLAKQLLPAAFVDQLKARWIDRRHIDVNNQDALSRLICQHQGWDEKMLHTYDLNYLMASTYLDSLHL